MTVQNPIIVLSDVKSLSLPEYAGKLLKFIPSPVVAFNFNIVERKGCGRVETLQRGNG